MRARAHAANEALLKSRPVNLRRATSDLHSHDPHEKRFVYRPLTLERGAERNSSYIYIYIYTHTLLFFSFSTQYSFSSPRGCEKKRI